MTIAEAFEHVRVIRDMMQEGRIAIAIWLAEQCEEAIRLARSFQSLLEPQHGRFFTVFLGSRARENRRLLQRAVDAAWLAGGGTIHIPPGTYPICPRLDLNGRKNITFRGGTQ